MIIGKRYVNYCPQINKEFLEKLKRIIKIKKRIKVDYEQ